MMEQKNFNDTTTADVIEEIIMSNRIGDIAVILSDKLNIEPLQALKRFYESDTCERLHNRATGLYLYGDTYIADDFIIEMQNKQ